MMVGLIVMFASPLRRRAASPIAARLLFLGTVVSLIGTAMSVARVEFDPLIRMPLIVLLLAAGIGCRLYVASPNPIRADQTALIRARAA